MSTRVHIQPVPVKMHDLDHQLRELQLIRCSLIPGEVFSFILPSEDVMIWSSLLDALDNGVDDETGLPTADTPPCSARISVRVPGSPVWFEVRVPEGPILRCSDVCVRGENISRDQQEHWQSVISQSIAEVQDSEFPVYELLSLHLLPKLHEHNQNLALPTSTGPPSEIHSHQPKVFHALLTSHHLVSVTKRKLMKAWSSELHIAGFAMIGYPGLIYAEGGRENVEQFVRNVKGMNWLALRVRFVEQVEPESGQAASVRDGWVEVQKISEVLELMRKRGRESYITQHGIGSGSK